MDFGYFLAESHGRKSWINLTQITAAWFDKSSKELTVKTSNGDAHTLVDEPAQELMALLNSMCKNSTTPV